MTALSASSDDDDAELAALLASLQMRGDPHHPSPPTTPARRIAPVPSSPESPPSYSRGSLALVPNPSRSDVSSANARVYVYSSPTRSGVTREWSIAGSATQGIRGGHVRSLPSSPKKKSRGKKAAYVVFCGKRCGVFLTWDETHPLVLGVPNSIHRGYASYTDALAAFAFARRRGWTRATEGAAASPIRHLPLPFADSDNPLHGSETLDDRWYVVYCGICPGVYRSHLECQLNTVGVPRSLHESIVGEAAARAKYTRAVSAGLVRTLPPVYHGGVDNLQTDPFM